MSKPIVRIHNSQTDEVIDREMTAAEYAQYQADQATQATAKAEAQTKEMAKAALLERLGITQDEANLLLS